MRSTTQMMADIDSLRYNRKKSKSLAPDGYEFHGNRRIDNESIETRTDFRTIKWWLDNGYKVVGRAFNMYDEPLDDYIAIYRKREGI